jgi:hypothetical protein
LRSHESDRFCGSYGVDNGACGTRVAPCRSFAGAIDNTAPGGVVKAIDTADYSASGAQLTITTPVTIDGAGTGASYIGTSNAIFINDVASGMVTVRDLTMNVPPNLTAIDASGSQVHLENLTITGEPGYSIGIELDSGSLTTDHVTIVGAGNAVQLLGGKA